MNCSIKKENKKNPPSINIHNFFLHPSVLCREVESEGAVGRPSRKQPLEGCLEI